MTTQASGNMVQVTLLILLLVIELSIQLLASPKLSTICVTIGLQ